MSQKVSQYYSYVIYAVGCIAIAMLALHFNSTPTAVAKMSEHQAVSGETIELARTLSEDNFDFAAERELVNSLGGQPFVSMDETSKEIVNANRQNIESLYKGEAIKTKLRANAEPLTADIQEAWVQIQKSLKGTKGYLNGGVAEFRQALICYDKGMSLKQFPADERGNNHLKDANRKFIQILKSNPHPLVREYSMYFLGDIGFHLWDENMDMPGAAYMIELIRATDNQDLAQKAWFKLNAQIHFGYTGSGGDNTPKTWTSFLAQLHGLTIKHQNFPLISSTGN